MEDRDRLGQRDLSSRRRGGSAGPSWWPRCAVRGGGRPADV